MGLRDRTAIVAGASGAIGSATVRAFLAAGMRVAAAAPADARLDALVRETAAPAERFFVVPTDITQRTAIGLLVEKTLVAFGRIDVLANVAGIGSPPSLADTPDDEIARVVAVNLTGPAHLMRAVLPAMRAQRSGAIVNIGSVAGEAGVMGIYSGSKFGLRGLTDSVRREVKSLGIGVTLIEPGFVASPMNGAMKGLPGPEIVAAAILAAIERPRRVAIVPGSYRLPVTFFKLLPGLADLVFGDARVQVRLNAASRAERGGNG